MELRRRIDQSQPVIHAERVVQVVIVHCELFQQLVEYIVGVILREASTIFLFTTTSERD